LRRTPSCLEDRNRCVAIVVEDIEGEGLGGMLLGEVIE